MAAMSESKSPAGHRFSRRDWATYFDAIASGELIAKPHTARRRAGEAARTCPYEDVAVAGLAKVKAAIRAHGVEHGHR